jgi:hypothetical protein
MYIGINLKPHKLCVSSLYTNLDLCYLNQPLVNVLDFGILKSFEDDVYFVTFNNAWESLFLWHFNLIDNMILHNVCG